MVLICHLRILTHVVFFLIYYIQRHTQRYDVRREFEEHEREIAWIYHYLVHFIFLPALALYRVLIRPRAKFALHQIAVASDTLSR